MQESIPNPRRPLIERFEPLPHPENITVIAKNPRLKQLKSSNMLNMSVELTLDWDQPQSEKITNYEIYTPSSYLCAYEHFGEKVGTVVNGNLTEFNQTFSTSVHYQDTSFTMLVLVILFCHYTCTILTCQGPDIYHQNLLLVYIHY